MKEERGPSSMSKQSEQDFGRKSSARKPFPGRRLPCPQSLDTGNGRGEVLPAQQAARYTANQW